jgi:hypothetical protein
MSLLNNEIQQTLTNTPSGVEPYHIDALRITIHSISTAELEYHYERRTRRIIAWTISTSYIAPFFFTYIP